MSQNLVEKNVGRISPQFPTDVPNDHAPPKQGLERVDRVSTTGSSQFKVCAPQARARKAFWSASSFYITHYTRMSSENFSE